MSLSCLKNILISFLLININISLVAMEENSPNSSNNSNLLNNVAIGLNIATNVIIIAIQTGLYQRIWQLITTGTWETEDYTQHKKVTLKQVEESNRIKLSTAAMKECWNNAKELENAIKIMSEGRQKNNAIQLLHDTQENCAKLVAQHTNLFATMTEPHASCNNKTCMH